MSFKMSCIVIGLINSEGESRSRIWDKLTRLVVVLLFVAGLLAWRSGICR